MSTEDGTHLETTSAAIKTRRASVVGVLLGRAWLTAHPARAHRLRPAHSYLGLFVRSLVGLDRAAAVEAMSDFLNDKTLCANQIEFINVIIESLTQH
jgi:hypothetical protein